MSIILWHDIHLCESKISHQKKNRSKLTTSPFSSVAAAAKSGFNLLQKPHPVVE